MVSNQLAVILGTLGLIGTVLLLVLLILVTVWSTLRGNGHLVKRASGAMALLAGIYGALWLGAGLLSRDTVKGAEEEKYFCEIDCHLAYRVVAIWPAEQVPGASGRVWAVELRTRFDEITISPRRGKEAPLWPSPRRVELRDARGEAYDPMAGIDGWFRDHGVHSVPLSQELRPGDSYTTTLLFDLPVATTPANLLVEDADWINTLVIGSEESPWHGKVLLPVPAVRS